MERFLVHIARARALHEQQLVNIYTISLLEPLKTDVELSNPHDMEIAMFLARAYEQRAAIAYSNKSTVVILPAA